MLPQPKYKLGDMVICEYIGGPYKIIGMGQHPIYHYWSCVIDYSGDGDCIQGKYWLKQHYNNVSLLPECENGGENFWTTTEGGIIKSVFHYNLPAERADNGGLNLL